MNSSRFPGKVLKPVLNITLLEYQYERLKKINNIYDIVILTTNNVVEEASNEKKNDEDNKLENI